MLASRACVAAPSFLRVPFNDDTVDGYRLTLLVPFFTPM
jgi:hypothetical protein